MITKTSKIVKQLTLALSLLAASLPAFAQKGDSLLIHNNELSAIVRQDTALYQKQVTVALDTIYKEVRKPTDYDLYIWREYAKDIQPVDSIQYNARFDLTGKRLVLSPTQELVFFSSDRYAEVHYRYSYDSTELIREGFLTYKLWKELSLDSLNLIALYERNYRDREYEVVIECESFIIPLKNGTYRTSLGTSGNLQPNTYTAADIPSQRQLQDDTDTVNVNGKYGLYTFFGQEVIPPIYDSIQMDDYDYIALAYRNGTISLVDYFGSTVRDSLKAAKQLNLHTQVIDRHNRMYYVDLYGNEREKFSQGFMSVDDILYPITPGSRILPKEKRTRDFPVWIEFSYPWYEKKDAIEKGRKERWWEFMADTVYHYGLEDIMNSDRYSQEAFEYYEMEIYPIPKGYKDLKLTSNRQEFYYTGDYRQLPAHWIIAQKKGKYGVFSIRNPNEPVLPFTYSSITGVLNNRSYHLLLERNGLKCYYPIHSEPRYKLLEPFTTHFARFRLPDGRWGWLDFNGNEYFD